SYTVGMALSGLFVYWVGTTGAFILDAGLFIIVLILVLTLRMNIELSIKQDHFMIMMKEALSYIRSNPLVLHLMILHAVVGLTAFDALVALAAKHFYAQIVAVSLGIGLINAARAVGLVIGPMVLGRWVTNSRLGWLLFAEALSLALWALVIENFYLSLIASIGVGFVTTTLWSYTYTLLQHHTHRDFYGRVIAYNDMIFLGVGASVSLLIGYLAQKGVALGIITLILGSVFAIAILYYHWIRRMFLLKEIG
ncbi:MFS transporter, partial [Sulfuricurvum sp.]|uniref:MFS transporter n=1 Tax=Sulfuricurvum sp. TaxID=2025608 RepID=UPI003BB5D741